LLSDNLKVPPPSLSRVKSGAALPTFWLKTGKPNETRIIKIKIAFFISIFLNT
jgi:hypothetical protein